MPTGVKIGITGLPGAGKTHALRRVIEMLEQDSKIIGGMLEIKEAQFIQIFLQAVILSD